MNDRILTVIQWLILTILAWTTFLVLSLVALPDTPLTLLAGVLCAWLIQAWFSFTLSRKV